MFSSYYMDAHGHVYPNRLNQDDVRVAVVAYEDREQVGGLVVDLQRRLINQGIPFDILLGAIADALREFADPTPPKPEEPTGLGAVVEDADGRLWVYNGPGKYPWGADVGGYGGNWNNWESLPAPVRVLSEGIR